MASATLALGLVSLAFGLFMQTPGWWKGCFALLGLVLLIAWTLGYPKRASPERRSAWRVRRQQAITVRPDRRRTDYDRRAERRGELSRF